MLCLSSWLGVISANAQCPEPYYLTVDPVTTTEAGLHWISTADTFEVHISPENDTDQYFIVVDTTGYLLTGLMPATLYEFQVRAICNGMAGPWSYDAVFRTHLTNPSVCGVDIPIHFEGADCQSPDTFPIDVADWPGQELGTDVRLKRVKLLIEHQWNHDLILTLRAPGGQEVLLINRRGGQSHNFGNPYDTICQSLTVLEDGYCFPSIASFPPSFNDSTNYVGVFNPEEALSSINDAGGPANGTWTLQICDAQAAHTGQLKYAALEFAPALCGEIRDLQLTQVNGDAIGMGWTLHGTADSIYVEYAAMDFTPGTDSTANGQLVVLPGSVSQVLIDSLQASTTYTFYLRTRCGNDFGENVCFRATTECGQFVFGEDFDNMPLCNSYCTTSCSLTGTWHNVGGSYRDWRVNADDTPTGNTGPEADVSGSGHYIYAESSFPCNSSTVTALESNCLSIGTVPAGTCSFTFHRHMQGQSMGTLRLLTHVDGQPAGVWDTLWVQSGNQPDGWQKQYVDLSPYAGQIIRLRFEAVSGGPRSDIALDELRFLGDITDLGEPSVYYADTDQDGYGDPAAPAYFCGLPAPGYVSNPDDCDDTDAGIHPGTAEIYCNQVDENCNGMADDSELPAPVLPPTASFCPGEDLQMTLSVPPVGEYYWYVDGQLLGVGQSVSLPGVSEGQQLVVKDSMQVSGYVCVSPPVSVDLVAWPMPYIGPDTVITHCTGVPFAVDQLPVNDYAGLPVSIKVYGDWPPALANEITGDTILPEDYGTIYYVATTSTGCTDVKLVDFGLLSSPQVKILPDQDTVDICPDNVVPLTAGIVQGAPPYQFVWSNGFEQSVALVSPLSPPGTAAVLSVELTDNTGCIAKDSVVIRNSGAVTSFAITDKHDVSACGGADGGFTVTPQGGTPPYTISWSGPVSGTLTDVLSATITNLTQGAYNLEITDSSPAHCAVSYSGIVINAPGLLVQVDTIADVSCYGAADGKILLDVIAGNPDFSWSDGTQMEDRYNLAPGSYSVTVSDANCDLVFDDITIGEPNILQAFVAEKADVRCKGSQDGKITLHALGGTAPYMYSWAGPMPVSGDSISGLMPGTYFCTVTDDHGCTTMLPSIELTEPDSLSVLADFRHVTCHGSDDGWISLLAIGGTAPYQYDWNTAGFSGSLVTQLAPASYDVTITDAHGCTIRDTIVIDEPPAITLDSLDVDFPTCEGLMDGSITAYASGGSGGLTYHWDVGVIGSQLSSIGEGTYHLWVTDDNACQSDTISIPVDAYQVIQAIVDSASAVSCYGMTDGYLSVQATGGTFPYSYQWSEGSQTSFVENLSPGSYDVTITDAIGCERVLDSLVVEEPAPLSLSVQVDSVACWGTHTGRIVPVVQGGTLPYSYQWSTGDTVPVLAELDTGFYALTVTDARGCAQMWSGELYEPPVLVSEVQSLSMAAACVGPPVTGSAQLAVTGGVPPYAFAWSNGDSIQNPSDLSPGQYDVTVTDSRGCTNIVGPVTIYQTEQDFAALPVVVQDVSCAGLADGTIVLEGVGGTLPYHFHWSNGTTTGSPVYQVRDTLTGLGPGSYNLTITDAHGCVLVSDTFSILEPAPLAVYLDSIKHNVCFNDLQGRIFTTTGGGVPPYHYLWNTLSFEEDPDSLSAGTYSVTVSDANGCTASLPEPVVLGSIVDSFSVLVDEVVDRNCADGGDIFISVTGDVDNPQFLWSNASTVEDQSGLLPGYYSVTVVAAAGCMVSLDSIFVGAVPGDLQLSADTIRNVSCAGGSDGALVVSTQGGDPPYTYYWSSGAGDSLKLYDLPAGAYGVTVTDANDCVAYQNGLVISEPAPLALDTAFVTDAPGPDGGGSILLFVSGGVPPYLYTWDAKAGNQTSNPAQNLKPGLYSVTVTDHNGCSLTITGIFVDLVIGTTQPDAPAVRLYPNPLTGRLLIESAAEPVSVFVYDWAGRRQAVPALHRQNGLWELDFSALAPGVYPVRIELPGGRLVVRPVVKSKE